MSGKPAAIPLFADAYLADTMHLTTEEHGAYLLLLMAAWRFDDCSLPNDDKKLARIAGLSLRKWTAIRATILDFWSQEGDRIHQPRLRKERGYVLQKSESNRKNSEKRWKRQATENKQSGECDRICDGNAPPPPPIEEPNGSYVNANALTGEIADDEDDREPPPASGHDHDLFGEELPPEAPAELKPEHVVEIWNEIAPRIARPTIRDLTAERRQLVRARIAGYSLDDFSKVFSKVERSAFLRGELKWRGATFDWLMKKQNFQKVIEGNYDD